METHRGKTSLRHKSVDGAWVGTAVPHGARKLDYTKEFEWMPSPHVEVPEAVYRDIDSAKQVDKRLTKNGFRLGSGPPGELFDKTVRVQATNFTAAPDKQLVAWISSNRTQHPRPFALSGFPVENPNDRSFVGRHRHYNTEYHPFEDYESQHLQTALPNHRYGYRPAHRTAAQGHPFKPTRVQDPLPGTDRNPRLHAARAPDQMDRHDGAGAHSHVWIR